MHAEFAFLFGSPLTGGLLIADSYICLKCACKTSVRRVEKPAAQ